MSTTSQSVMDRLREATRPMHDAAEAHPFQKAFFSGSLPASTYANYLSQLLLVHRALESELKRHTKSIGAFASTLEDHQYQEPFLLKDLQHFKVDPQSITESKATQKLIA